MAKKVVTVITVKTDDGFVEPGEVLDVSKLSKEDVTRLYDLGAIKIEEVANEEVKVEEAPKTETPVKAASTPVKATPSK